MEGGGPPPPAFLPFPAFQGRGSDALRAVAMEGAGPCRRWRRKNQKKSKERNRRRCHRLPNPA